MNVSGVRLPGPRETFIIVAMAILGFLATTWLVKSYGD